MYGLISCTETIGDEGASPALSPHYLSLSEPFGIHFERAQKSRASIDVESQNVGWQISATPAWLRCSPSSLDYTEGEVRTQVAAEVEENFSADTIRTALCSVDALCEEWYMQIPLLVTQNAAVPYILPEINHVALPGRLSSYTIPIHSNCNWSVSTTEDWLMVTKEANLLHISTSATNSNRYPRNGIVRLYFGEIGCNIEVEQEPMSLNLCADTLKFENTPSTYTLRLEADKNWEASTTNSWIDVTPSTGTEGIQNIDISVTANNSDQARHGAVYLSMDEQIVKIPVVQKGYYTEVAPKSIEIGSHAVTLDLAITSNDSWTIILPQEQWLHTVSETGQGNESITLLCDENATPTPRSTSLSIQPRNSNEVKIGIVQNGRFLRPSQSSIAFFAKGGQQTLSIDTDAKYTWTKDGHWFNVAQEGNSFIVSALANITNEWLEGSLTLQATDLIEGELVIVIPVVQGIEGSTFTKEGYTQDIDYNLLNSHGLNLSIVSYTQENNYNTGSSEGPTKEGYSDSGETEQDISKDSYSEENNYDQNTNP